MSKPCLSIFDIVDQVQRIDGMTKEKIIFLYAVGREAEFQLGNKTLTLMNQPKSAPTKTYSRISNDDRLVTIEAETNNLCVIDLQSRRVV